MFLEKGRGKVFEVFYQRIVGLRPVHGEVEAVFIPLGGIGKVAGVGAVGNDKQLQVFEQGCVAVKALFAVAVYLIKGFANGHAAFFKFNLDQRQAIDQYRDVIAVSVRAGLLELLGDLHLVAHQILFINQVNVFQLAVIKSEVTNVVDMDFTGLVEAAVTRAVQVLLTEASPLPVVKRHTVQGLNLRPRVGQHRLLRGKRDKLISLIAQVLNQLALQVRFALVAVSGFPGFGIFIEDNEVISLGDGVCLLGHSASCVPVGQNRQKSIQRYRRGKVVVDNPGQKQHADRTVATCLSVSVSDFIRFGEAEQQVAIVFVLLLTQCDFAGQAFADRVG
ncbi:hypothetical protein SRABI106_01161 [Rahnella aquatilis]|nr:hypothetical protein SRABI106_01161 [Rahnella aquatilis]